MQLKLPCGSTSPGRRISAPCLTHSVHSFSTLAALWEQPLDAFAVPHSCNLTRLDSAWVTAQPQCQVRVHQAPWQMGRLSQSPSAVHRLFCSLWTCVCFYLSTQQRVCCFSGLSPGEQVHVQSSPRSTCTSAETSRAFGRSLSVWKKARILIYFETLNTCIKHPRECSYCPPQLSAAHAIPNIAQCLGIREANHKYISYSHL